MEPNTIELEFRATYRDHADFAESVVWMDYHTELITQLHEIHTALETEDDVDKLRQLQGAAKAIRHLLNMPSNILELLEPVAERNIEGT